MSKKPASGILATVHASARDLAELGLVDAITMRRLEALCLTPVKTYEATTIRRIRHDNRMSQAVFAALLNVGPATVAAWERGGKRPSGPAAKLLDLVERKGIAALL